MSTSTDPSVTPEVRTLYIFGAGGHGREVAWLARQTVAPDVDIRFLADRDHCLTPSVNGIVLECWETAQLGADSRFVVAVGDPGLRSQIAERLARRGAVAGTLVHPRTEMSSNVDLGPGVVVCAGSVLTTEIRLAQHVHVNVSCSIAHDVQIGEFSTLSPGVRIAGNVQVGARVFLGIGAVVINGQPGAPLVIGDDAVVAAGACVTGRVAAGALVAGVPAVRKR